MTDRLKNVEKVSIDSILPDLERGRRNFDKPHTIAVVMKIREIIKNNPQLNLDEEVLVIAAYAHDWGYAGLVSTDETTSLTDVKEAKAQHMINGAKKIQDLMTRSEFNFLNQKQKDRIVHLVSVHDKLSELKDVDELILMEADTLGAMDVTLVKPSFNYDDGRRWMENTKKNRISRFITDHSKSEAERLMVQMEEYYEQQRGS